MYLFFLMVQFVYIIFKNVYNLSLMPVDNDIQRTCWNFRCLYMEHNIKYGFMFIIVSFIILFPLLFYISNSHFFFKRYLLQWPGPLEISEAEPTKIIKCVQERLMQSLVPISPFTIPLVRLGYDKREGREKEEGRQREGREKV